MTTNTSLNNALLRLSRRAEAADRATLVGTFVDTGALVTLLASRDHQIIFGRRGTGKTHALLYLAATAARWDDIAVYVDLRTIGSTGGLYSDSSIPLAERGTRLLADTLAAIHEALLSAVLASSAFDLSQLGPALDALAEAATQVVVTGPVDQETTVELSSSEGRGASATASVEGAIPKASLSLSDKSERGQVGRSRVAVSGQPRHRVHFAAVGSALARISTALGRRLWVLLDEWSVVPLDLQPYLADLIRRALLPVQGISVKIAAIEQRSVFQLTGDRGEYLGIELGADVAADLTLDDFMVFDNSAERATQFFRELLFKHYTSVEAEAGVTGGPASPQEFIQMVFTQRNTFDELVNAAEGVPRDAINVLALAAQRAVSDPISVVHVRSAARTWYQRDKETAVSASPSARSLLLWVVDEVIAHRRARAFLLRSGERHPLIDALFDARVLHVVKHGIAAHDQPGVRYDVYKIDYGCYVDLLATQKAPAGLLALDDPDDSAGYVDVPPDDYRAIRRAILDLNEFERQRTTLQAGDAASTR